MFNMIGVVWMLLLFIPFTLMVWNVAQHLPAGLKTVDSKFQSSEIAFSTAIFHTAFNLINIGVLVWFVPQIARTVVKWVPEKKAPENKRLRYISQNLVDLGELNIAEAEDSVRKMATHCNVMYKGYVEALNSPEKDLSSEISRLKHMEEEADLMMQDITEYLVKCVARDMTPGHAGNVAAMIRIVAELEESTDCIYRLVKLTERRYNKGHKFTDHHNKQITQITDLVGQALGAVENYLLRDVPAEVMTSVKTLDSQTNSMRKSFNKEAIKRMSEGDIRVEMLYTDMNNQLRALGNHAYGILEASQNASVQ